MLKWTRIGKMRGVNRCYLPGNLRPGRYMVMSVGIGPFIDRDCELALVIKHKGKFVRCRLH